MEEFKEQVKKSFIACKSDISLLKHENDQLREALEKLVLENKNLKEKINNTDKEILELKTQLKAFEIALDYIKSFNMQNQTTNLAQNINSQTDQNNIVLNKENNLVLENSNLANTEQKVEVKTKKENKIKFEDPYQALMAFKVKSNKRELLKKKILSLINNGGIAQNELKFLIVDHFEYCSKASFYNYLKELEKERKVEIKRVDSKNLVFLTQQITDENFLN